MSDLLWTTAKATALLLLVAGFLVAALSRLDVTFCAIIGAGMALLALAGWSLAGALWWRHHGD